MLKNNIKRAVYNHTSEHCVALCSEKRYSYASYSCYLKKFNNQFNFYSLNV